jgi:oligoribonuclease NrnB/cAMP/cGMP phosphodiesterase (DHH superfamily)
MGKFSKMKKMTATPKLFNLRRITNLFERLTTQNSADCFYSKEEFHSILVREKARADRNGHGFSLVAIQVTRNEDISSVVKYLQKKIRAADEIGWFDHNTLGVLLYNTSANGAWQFVNKNRTETEDVCSLFKCSVYSYPNEWCAF